MIKLDNVYKSFGPNHVLRGCTLEVQDGETLTIIGGSGTGKSVTLKLMVGLLRPDQGKVFVDETEISRLPEEELSEVQKKFAYVFQMGALFDSLTIEDNVAFGLRHMQKVAPEKIPNIVRERLEMVGFKRDRTLEARGVVRRHAQARGVCARYCHEPGIHFVRRTDHGPRPDHVGCHQ